MLADFFDELVEVQRLDFVFEGSEITTKKDYQTYISNLCCQIQPIDSEISKDITEGFGKNLVLFCANQDIIEGDRIIRSGGKEYRVVAVENFKGIPGGRLKHLEIIIRAFES